MFVTQASLKPDLTVKMTREQVFVEASLFAGTIFTKNTRDPDMHSSKKVQQMYFGMNAHIGADAESDQVPTVRCKSGIVQEMSACKSLLDGEVAIAVGEMGNLRVGKRSYGNTEVTWHVAIGPGKCRQLYPDVTFDALIDNAKKILAGILAKMEHPFRVAKRQLGFAYGAQRTDMSGGMNTSSNK